MIGNYIPVGLPVGSTFHYCSLWWVIWLVIPIYFSLHYFIFWDSFVVYWDFLGLSGLLGLLGLFARRISAFKHQGYTGHSSNSITFSCKYAYSVPITCCTFTYIVRKFRKSFKLSTCSGTHFTRSNYYHTFTLFICLFQYYVTSVVTTPVFCVF